jgi:hypothetical protein
MFECHQNGTVTFKKEPAECPTPGGGGGGVVVYPYPYGYPGYGYPGAYPVTQGPSELVIEQPPSTKTSFEKVAPYAAVGIVGVALLYTLLK